MTFDPTKPYDELPRLPPRVEIETPEILRACIAAHRALAELKGAADSVPNPQLLIDALALREAQASSEIENVVTTGDLLYRFLAMGDEKSDPSTREVARYRPALLTGIEMLKTRPLLTVDLFTQVCSLIVGYDTRVRPHVVRLENPTTREIVYTPPVNPSLIKDLLTNLQTFVHAPGEEPDPLVRLAVFHYQFEAIHPFPDGNGRTGRVLNILYLIQQNLLEHPILYLSRYFQMRRGEHYSKLRAVTSNEDWEGWVSFVLRGVAETAREARDKIAKMRDLRIEFGERARRDAPTASSETLLDLLFMRPYSTIGMAQQAEDVSRVTARSHLLALEDAGMLSSMRAGRWRLFVNEALVELLEG